MENRTALIEIVTWFLLVTSGVTTIGRMCLKYSLTGFFSKDDLCAVMSFISNIGAGVAISIAAENGLGKPVATLSSDQVHAVQKGLYATGILFVSTVMLAKLSVVFLLRMLFVHESHRLAIHVLGVFIVVQGFSSTIAAIVPCQAPDVWAIGSGACYDLEAFWCAVCVLNITTDVALVALPCFMISSVQMSFPKRAFVAGCFGVRIIDIAACAVQVAQTKAFGAEDFTATLWLWYFVGQITQTATIVSSNIPYLRQLLFAFPSGMFQSDEIRRRGLLQVDSIRGFSATDDRMYITNNIEGLSNSTGTSRRGREPSQDGDD